jgi:hypothetical protein
LKPERWGSPLVQEKYQEEKACDKRHPYRIIILILLLLLLIIIIIIIILIIISYEETPLIFSVPLQLQYLFQLINLLPGPESL